MKFRNIVHVDHKELAEEVSLHNIQESIELAKVNFRNKKPDLSHEQIDAQFRFIAKWNYTKIHFAFLCNNTETITAYNDFMLKINHPVINYQSIPQL